RCPRYPLARSRTTLRFFLALRARFTRATVTPSLSLHGTPPCPGTGPAAVFTSGMGVPRCFPRLRVSIFGGRRTRRRYFLPRSLAIFLSSAGASTTSWERRRLRLEVLCSRMWFLLARRRMILPEPVTRKRFLAPLWDLFFGMSPSSPTPSMRRPRNGGRHCSSAAPAGFGGAVPASLRPAEHRPSHHPVRVLHGARAVGCVPDSVTPDRVVCCGGTCPPQPRGLRTCGRTDACAGRSP